MSLASLCLEYVGNNFGRYSAAEVAAHVPPGLCQQLFQYLVQKDLVANNDITPLLPFVVRYPSSYDQTVSEEETLLPSLDLSGCKTVTTSIFAQIARVVPHLRQIVTAPPASTIVC